MKGRRYYLGDSAQPPSRGRAAWRSVCLTGAFLAVTCPCVRAQSAGPPAPPDLSDCAALTGNAPPTLPDSAENADHLIACGKDYRDRSEFQRALRAFTAALEMTTRRGDRKAMGEALGLHGDMYRLTGDNDRADAEFQQSLHIAEALGDKLGQASAVSYLGRLRTQQGRRVEALKFHARSLELYEAVGDQQGVAIANNNVGLLFSIRGDYVAALPYLERSLQALQRLGDQRRSATVLVNIATIYERLGDYDRARSLSQEALDIRQQLNDREGMGRSLEAIALNDEARGNYAAALAGLEKSLQVRRSLSVAYGTAESLNNIAVLYRTQGSYAQALKYLHESYDAARRLDNPALLAEVLTNLGEVYYLQGRMALALQTLRQGLSTAEKAGEPVGAINARLELGRLFARTHSLDAASDAFNRCLEFYRSRGDRNGEADVLIELAEIERRQGQYSHGLEQAARAQQLADAMELPEFRWRSLTAVGRLQRAMHHPAAAAHAFEDAIAVIEALRDHVGGGEGTRSAFLESRMAPYQERISLALGESRTADGFYFAERSKARALLDVIRGDRFPVTKAMTDDERARELRLRSALSSFNSQALIARQAEAPDETLVTALKEKRETARLEYEDFQSVLYAAHPELRVARADTPVVRSTEAQRLVPRPTSAILEFVIASRRAWVFAITTAGAQAFALRAAPQQLGADIQRFRQQLASRDLRVGATSRSLFDEVLGPLREVLHGKTDLTIVPDGVLWDLPFQALESAPDHYLIEDSAIAYAPSVTVLRETMRPRPEHAGEATLLAFGNPAFGAAAIQHKRMTLMGDRLEPLPEAEKQVRQIGQLYGSSSRVYVGADADEDRWKAEAGHYRILHLATHGVVDSRSPLYSYVVLAKPAAGSREDGLLEAWELMNMRLTADLVVLSACETARGQLSIGEGVIGLMWAAFVAGSPATVVSQWKVESASSTELMVAFHREWNAGRRGLSKARALQLASLRLLHGAKTSHPYYWAGYILVGDGR
jgi:CHAT domain-containing protein/uncharacterized protein HemY